MKKILGMGIVMVMGLYGACAPRAAGPNVETLDGIEYVHNPDVPIFPNRTVHFEEELTFGGDQGDDKLLLNAPSDLQVDEYGHIYVSDSRDLDIKVFDPQGRYVRTIGKRGEGPGEFQSLTDLQFMPDGRLMVFDLRARRTSFFGVSGDFIKSHAWRNSRYEILIVHEAGYLTDEIIYGENEKKIISEYDFDGIPLASWGDFKTMGFQVKSSGNTTISVSIPYTPRSILAGDPVHQWIYHCYNSAYEVEVYDIRGNLIRKIDRPYQPISFTHRDAQEYYADVDRRNNKAFSDLAREVDLPNVKTVTERMGVDDRGNLWVQTHEVTDEEGSSLVAYDIFNTEGHYICRTWLEFEPRLFVRGKMYRIHSDEETGFRSIKRYRVSWSYYTLKCSDLCK